MGVRHVIVVRFVNNEDLAVMIHGLGRRMLTCYYGLHGVLLGICNCCLIPPEVGNPLLHVHMSWQMQVVGEQRHGYSFCDNTV